MTRTWHVCRSRVLCTSNLHRLCNRTCPKRARRAEERGGKRAGRKTEVRRGVTKSKRCTRERKLDQETSIYKTVSQIVG